MKVFPFILTFCFLSVSSFAVLQRKKVPYELYLDPTVQTLYPDAAVCSLKFDDLKDVDVTGATAGRCLVTTATQGVTACLLYTSPSPRD